MHQRGMPLYLTKWVAAFNTARKMAFGFDQQSELPPPYQYGLPQGSPVSPILFLIYSNAMLEKDEDFSNTINTSYVDDVCKVQLSQSVPEANTHLKERTEQLLAKGIPLGLTFKTSKTELLYCLALTSKDKSKSLSSHPPATNLARQAPRHHRGRRTHPCHTVANPCLRRHGHHHPTCLGAASQPLPISHR